MSLVAQHDKDGFYLGEVEDYDGPLPHNSVREIPKIIAGYWPRWVDGWTQVENHIGKQGYIAGQAVIIKKYGPLPEGWSDSFVDPRSPEEIRRREILAELQRIDVGSVRAMRATRVGSGSREDEVLLAELDAHAEELRRELASLKSGDA